MQPFSLLQKAAAPVNSDVAKTESKAQVRLLPSESNIASHGNQYCSTYGAILLYSLSNIAHSTKQWECQLASTEAVKKGLILDGFPRTVAQAEALDELYAKHDTAVHAVLDLQVAEDELVQRLLKRGEASGRSDDNLETIQKRLGVYHAQTAPIAEHYAKKGVHYAIEGSGAISDITARIAKVIDALN